MNKIKKVINNSVLSSDLLSTQASFRYGGQPVYASFFPGIVSIIAVSCFVAIFIIKIMSVLQLQDITSYEHQTDNVQSAEPIQDIMFAMKLDGIDFTEFEKYFQYTLIQTTIARMDSTAPKVRTERVVDLKPCKIDYWLSMGIDSISTLFQKRGMSAFYCPTQAFKVQGTSDEDTYVFSEIRLKECNATISPTCLPPATRAAYYSNYVALNEYFSMKLNIKDTIISPTSENPINNFLQRDILLSFSTTTGTMGYLKIADYEVKTDTNILPWSSYTSSTGYFIERFQTSTVPTNFKFLNLKLQKSTKKLVVQRQYGKIDDMLSYVGGLFGLLFYCVQFVMGSYNEYRYQLAIGQTLFDYDQKGTQVKQTDMNFWTYIKYSIYQWLSFFGCILQSWQQMKEIDQTRSQVTEQLDIRYLMKKITYLQNVIDVLITQDQKTCLLLTQLPTLNNLKKVRKISEFYTKNKQLETQTEPPINSKNQISNILFTQIGEKNQKNQKNQKKLKKLPPLNTRRTQNKDIQMQNSSSQKKIISLQKSGDFTRNEILISQSGELEGQQVMFQVNDAVARLTKRINQPINQRIMKKIPSQMLKRMKTLHNKGQMYSQQSQNEFKRQIHKNNSSKQLNE